MLYKLSRPTNRSRQCFLNGPAQSHNALIDDMVGQSSFVGPLCNRLCLSIPRCVHAVAAVIGLHLWCGPLAVFGRIWSVVINTIKLMLGCWRLTHIGIEVLKSVPTWADRDTTTTVTEIGTIMQGLTAPYHPIPNTVNVRSCHAVCGVLSTQEFGAPAATRFSRAISQCFRWHNHFPATRTMTQPTRLTPTGIRGGANYGQASKRLSNKINLSHVQLSFRNCITSAVDMQVMVVWRGYAIP